MNNLPELQIKTADLFECEVPFIRPLLESALYPWELLPKLKGYIASLIETGLEGYTLYAPGVLVGEGVTIHPSACIGQNLIIGAGTQVRPGAFIRGDALIGPDCVVGNSTELKNCVLAGHVQVPHYNYVGDSVLGSYAHMGAGAVCSNIKGDRKNIVIHGDREYETGLRKIGGLIGDHAEIGCNCVINPGTVIGKWTRVYPLTSVRGVIPPRCIVKAADRVVPRCEN